MAKRVEAFRAALVAADPKVPRRGLCAAGIELQPIRRSRGRQRPHLINATAGKSKPTSAMAGSLDLYVVGDAATRALLIWLGESETIPDGKKSSTNPPRPDELAEHRTANGKRCPVRPPKFNGRSNRRRPNGRRSTQARRCTGRGAEGDRQADDDVMSHPRTAREIVEARPHRRPRDVDGCRVRTSDRSRGCL